MASEVCGATKPYLIDDTLTCDLPAAHTDPTDAYPQGTPHSDSGHVDSISGEPNTWWG